MEAEIAWLAISMIFQGFGMYEKYTAAEQKTRALQLQAKESSLKRIDESISNYDILEKTLKTQLAESTTRGVGLGSPSFEAIQLDTINKIGKQEKNSELEESLFKKGIKIEKLNVKKNLYTSLFGDVAQTGFNMASFAQSSAKK